MDDKFIAGARAERIQAQVDAARYTQADLNRAAVKAWNDAIDAAIEVVGRDGGYATAVAFSKAVNVLRVNP